MLMDDLEILETFNVIAVSPHHEGVHSTKIYTHQGTSSSKDTVTELINQYCIQYGSDLNGRINAARKGLKIRKSPPILISEMLEIVAFQVPVPYYDEPMWILELDFEIYPKGSKKCEIQFKNGLKLEIPLSENALRQRRNKALELLFVFKYAHNRKRLQIQFR